MSHNGAAADYGKEQIILHMEDDDSAAYLFLHIVRGLKSNVRLYRVIDSLSAIAFLRKESPFANVPRPDVVILDINVPGDSGLVVLRTIRSDPQFASLPVIVFSSSNATTDRSEARDLRAEGYLVKSADLSAYQATAELALHLAG